MASATASICGAPVVALAASTSASTSSSSRVQLCSSLVKSRSVAKPLGWSDKTVSNGSRVNAFNVVNPETNIKFETLSFLPPLSAAALAKQVDYLLANKWIPCIEFDKNGTVSQTALHIPGYYDGRYWSMWKLPLFGATDASQVLDEVENCKKSYPGSFIRVIGFDNVRQVQVISFIVYKP